MRGWMGVNEKQQYSMKGVEGMVQPVCSIGVGEGDV